MSTSDSGPIPGADPACICRGNWRSIVRREEGRIGQQFRSHDGKVLSFFGIVHGDDDYYYGMWSKEAGLHLLSCVSGIEGYRYEAVDVARGIVSGEAGETPKVARPAGQEPGPQDAPEGME